jgi:hypothetical protein
MDGNRTQLFRDLSDRLRAYVERRDPASLLDAAALGLAGELAGILSRDSAEVDSLTDVNAME